jgi:hypothetical protein
MNQHVRQMDLAQLAFAAIAAIMPDSTANASLPEPMPGGLVAAAKLARLAPAGPDRAMVKFADALALSMPELLAMAVLATIETDPNACRAIALGQSPVGGSRPLVGLLATAFADFGTVGSVVLDLASGEAERCGCFRIGGEDAPLPERSLALSLPVLQALLGRAHSLSGVELIGDEYAGEYALALPPSVLARIAGWQAILASKPRSGLVIRAANEADGKAVAVRFACDLGLEPVWIAGDIPAGFAPWAIAAGALPIFGAELRSGERRTVPSLSPYDGPWLCVAGREGHVGSAHGEPASWLLDMPAAGERAALWNAGGLPEDVSRRAASAIRQGPSRIAEIAAAARQSARLRGAFAAEWTDMEHALASERHAALDGFAERMRGSVGEGAFVAPPPLAASLGRLLDHCRLRDGLCKGLGPAASNRYGPGVRALFHGPSGTGKSLAAQWLASRLSMPLFRVDLSAVMSKWIGETEKNLGQILAAAEHANVILLFDEADGLFGSRTDVSNANDKFANGQTNYLLQRLESWEGVVVLTSNARDRMDSAFTRRLDAIIEFPLPDAPARLRLWKAHLGESALATADLNRLAAAIDLAGGHIRNIVLGAAVAAGASGLAVNMEHVVSAAGAEYAKLGRNPPRELA